MQREGAFVGGFFYGFLDVEGYVGKVLIGQLSAPCLVLANHQWTAKPVVGKKTTTTKKNMHAFMASWGEHIKKEAKRCGYDRVNQVMEIKRNCNVLNVLNRIRRKCTTEVMEAYGEQTFQIGTFDVGEKELDPGGRL